MQTLLTTEKNGITYAVAVARAQTEDASLADPAARTRLLVFPRLVKSVGGENVADQFITGEAAVGETKIAPFTVELSPEVNAAVLGEIKAAFDADQAARAAAAQPPAE